MRRCESLDIKTYIRWICVNTLWTGFGVKNASILIFMTTKQRRTLKLETEKRGGEVGTMTNDDHQKEKTREAEKLKVENSK